MLTRSKALKEGISVDQTMSTYTRTNRGGSRLPNGSGVDLPRTPQDQPVRSDHGLDTLAAPTLTGTYGSPAPVPPTNSTTPPAQLHTGPSPDAATAATTTTTAAGTTSTPRIESAQTKGAIEIESSDDESASEASDSPSESEAELLVPTREEIAQILGLPHESGPTGLAKLVGAMTVDQAFDQHALPREYTEELQKAFSVKLASVPWPRRLPKNVLNPGQRRVDGQLVQMEEAIRLMMASIMSDRQEVALAVGLDVLVRAEKLRADRVRWSVCADPPDLTPEPLQMFSQEEQARIDKKVKDREKPRKTKFFRGQARPEQDQLQQRPALQPPQRGQSKSRPPRGESTPNGQGPRRL